MNVDHREVAAYSLGLLDQKDREDFEAHLAGCQSCMAELGDFSAMADLFADLGPVTVEDEGPDESVIVDLVARRATARRRQTRQRAWSAAAAAVVLLAGGIAAGLGLAPQKLQMTGTQFSATNPTSGFAGTVGLVTKTWGTQVTLELSKLKTNSQLKCQLIAVPKTGPQRVMVGWLIPPPGVGVPGHPAPLLLLGGTWIAMGDLSEILVQVVGGRTLLRIPI